LEGNEDETADDEPLDQGLPGGECHRREPLTSLLDFLLKIHSGDQDGFVLIPSPSTIVMYLSIGSSVNFSVVPPGCGHFTSS